MNVNKVHRINHYLARPDVMLAVAFVVSCAAKISVVAVGAPFVTIDDVTAYEGGFLVWFGHAPIQRMYLESWLYGLVSITTYVFRTIVGLTDAGLSSNFIVEGYRDFYANPGSYVVTFRSLVLFLDLLTVWLIHRICKRVFDTEVATWQSVLPPILYLFAYNTIWSDIVARPDAVVSFLSVWGMLLYLECDAGRHRGRLFGAAVFLGLAGGMKLHAALFAILVCIDLLRVKGYTKGIKDAAIFAAVSFFTYGVAAGSVLFDPSRYIKLRFLNYVDDHSPWLGWFDHFVVFFAGIGWLVLPLVVFAAWRMLVRDRAEMKPALQSVLLVSLVWLVVFASVRQLRAYWMLPVLPFFFILATHGLFQLRSRVLRGLAVAALVGTQVWASNTQIAEFRSVDYDGVSRWIERNARNRTIYVFGFDSLMLPKSNTALRNIEKTLENRLKLDRDGGMSFTLRHLKNWEEQQILMRIDMLEDRVGAGYNIYTYYVTPPWELKGVVTLDDIEVIVTHEFFDRSLVDEAMPSFSVDFELTQTATGPGGGGSGLQYLIYERKEPTS